MELSIIIPMYNEEKRIPVLLMKLSGMKFPKNWEFIFVNDGSKDGTGLIVKKFGIMNKVVISYGRNIGKGYAVQRGINNSKGRKIIFMDADCSINPSEIRRMYSYLKEHEIVVGTRPSDSPKVIQPFKRRLLRKIFNFYVRMLFPIGINDTLCGFKGFSRRAAKELFSDLRSKGWIFDIEILYKARKLNYPIMAIPIPWIYRHGSKMGATDAFRIFYQLLFLRMSLM